LLIIFKEEEMKKRVLCGLCAVVLVIAGCDAVKGLLGEDPGPDISGSGAHSVAVSFDSIAVGAGVLSPTDVAGVYTLAVSGVTETGPVTVSVSKSGYAFTPESLTAVVNRDEAQTVVFNAAPNGAAGSQTTDALALSFNAAFATPLQQSDITLWTGSAGVAKGGLSGSGTDYTLGIAGVAAEGEVFVTVVKDGYAVRPATVRVPVHHKTVGPATGGAVTYEPVEGNPSMVWEIHTFTTSDTLAFTTPIGSVTADYLIVAGGDGSNGNGGAFGSDYSGGGGAGGLLYKTGAVLPLQGSSVAVIVGTGGPGGSAGNQGANGEPSAIGNIEVSGGGGGGSGAGNFKTAGIAGKRSNGIAVEIAGNNGGSGSTVGGTDAGGGGGGAEGAGGAPWIAASKSASWVSAVTEGTAAFSRGGDGGSPGSAKGGTPGAHYGDGGSGGSGHNGIVIVRFQRPAVAP
jgi:hypothetical protein